MHTYPPTAKPISAKDIIADVYRLNQHRPALRLATNPEETAIAYWDEDAQRWLTVAAYAITGQWVQYPYEMRVNGEALIKQWNEVPRDTIKVTDGAR